jgi:hypothetical protein
MNAMSGFKVLPISNSLLGNSASLLTPNPSAKGTSCAKAQAAPYVQERYSVFER